MEEKNQFRKKSNKEKDTFHSVTVKGVEYMVFRYVGIQMFFLSTKEVKVPSVYANQFFP